ncbi:MAG: GGDEF domain-containing protein [Lachnospiraceae bacterium]|nr:GGDEF domain-containing protein [Lachnospiraceae bacterium]
MDALIQKLREFVNKDIAAQDESKTLAVLLRSSGLILALYVVIATIITFATKHYAVMALYMGLIALLAYSIYMTYHGTVFRALVVMNIAVLLLSCVGTVLYSWDSDFHIYLFYMILTIFFYTKMSAKVQMTTVFCNVGVMFLLASMYYGKDGIFDAPEYVFVLNLATFTGLMLSVGISFANKFVKAEYKLYQYNIQLKKLAGSDPLTGLMNRRNMRSVIDEIIPRMAHGDDMLSVAIGDIDFFKKVNDSRGHDCGDYVLKELSTLFEEFMENKGYAARWGGEEFLFVFTTRNADHAFVEIERLRSMIEKKDFHFADHDFKITMTFGLEEHNMSSDIDETIKKADEKLYMGKESGRNKVVY